MSVSTLPIPRSRVLEKSLAEDNLGLLPARLDSEKPELVSAGRPDERIPVIQNLLNSMPFSLNFNDFL